MRRPMPPVRPLPVRLLPLRFPVTRFLVGVALLTVAACSPARTASRDAPPVRPQPVRVDLRGTETFDPSAYPAAVPAEAPTAPAVAHDVPQTLLDNATAAAPAPPPPRPAPTPAPERPVTRPGSLRTITGYRVQIFQSSNKDEADRRVADAIAWWRRTNEGTPEVYTLYRAPYYRVRVGNYATRGEADRAARSVGGSFPGSFVVQDRVTVRQQ